MGWLKAKVNLKFSFPSHTKQHKTALQPVKNNLTVG
jgi:hypothetical protein